MPPPPSSSLTSWARVATGLRLVLNSASARTATEIGTAAARWAEHGADAAASARIAAAAAGIAAGLPKRSEVPPSARREGGTSGSRSLPPADADLNGRNEIDGARDVDPGADVLDSPPNLASAGAVPSEAPSDVGSRARPAMEREEGRIMRGGKGGGGGSDGAARQMKAVESSPPDTDTFSDDGKAGRIATDDDDATATISSAPAEAPSSAQQTNEIDAASTTTTTTLEEGRPVPTTRLSRAAGFASLGVGLAAGTAAELLSRAVGGNSPSSSSDSSDSPIDSHPAAASDANADRIAAHLCRMRGAALKLGQMLSMQDEALLPPPLARALERARGSAEAMPAYQLEEVLVQELGVGWRDRLVEFEELPFAAASIGQVHRAVISDDDDDDDDDDNVAAEGGGTRRRKVAMKVQYPGVSDSIDSDLNNLSTLVKVSGMAPPGLFIDEVIRVGREELKVECDYLREATNQTKFRNLVSEDELLSGPEGKLSVPEVIPELTTERVLTTELVPGGTVDKVGNLDQDERNRIGRAVLRLTLRELFVWRFMQTDPNWGNFLYDVGTGTTHLIDFGAARDYDKSFVDGYLRIVTSSADRDVGTLMDVSHTMGFLTGEENDIMLEAHKMSGYTVGEPFATNEPYDFARSGISARLSGHSSAFLQHRLTPPPEEVYTLHRKLAGAYNLCIKIGAIIPCRDLLDEVAQDYVFGAAPRRGEKSRHHS